MTEAAARDESAPTSIPFTGLRGAVARAMSAAWEAPRVAVAIDVNADAMLAARTRRQDEAGAGAKLSPTHFILRALALALREHPHVNGEVEREGVRLHERVDIGLAVDVPNGVLVPVLRDVDTKSVATIAGETARLAAQAREGTLMPSALRGATFTLSTLGATGISWFTPILNPAQIAILGAGAITRQPVAEGDRVVVGSVMTLTLVFDHRATDGFPAATFLAAVRERLEHPETL